MEEERRTFKKRKKIINVYNIHLTAVKNEKKKRYIITKLNTDYLIRGRGVWNTGRLIIGIQTLFNI